MVCLNQIENSIIFSFTMTKLARTNLTICRIEIARAYPDGAHLFKVNNRNRKMCEICSELTIKHQNDVTDVVLVSFLTILNRFYVSLVFLLLILNNSVPDKQIKAGKCKFRFAHK